MGELVMGHRAGNSGSPDSMIATTPDRAVSCWISLKPPGHVRKGHSYSYLEEEPFSGWTPEGLGSALRMATGELAGSAAPPRWRGLPIVAAAGLILAMAAVAAFGMKQLFDVGERARRSTIG